MKQDKLRGLLLGSLVGDAYSLSGHLIYDQKKLANSKLNLDTLNNPLSPLHQKKSAGDFTHYGDQTLWLLEYISNSHHYDPFEFGKIWQEKMNNYHGYLDRASKSTLYNLHNGSIFMASGSDSNDLSIVGRHAPIIFTIKSIDEIMDAIKLHTFLTHFEKEVLNASRYITEVTLAMIYNLDLEKTIKERSKYYGELVEDEIDRAFKVRSMDPNNAIKYLGQDSGLQGGLASTIYLLLNYHNDFNALLKANLLAGGDSAARAMVAGMVVGARYGFKAIQPQWIEKLNHYPLLQSFIK